MSHFFVPLQAGSQFLIGRPAVIALGNFDGVHLGHQELLRRAREIATRRGTSAFVVTFDPHPLQVLRPPHQRLQGLLEQQACMMEMGMDGVIYLRFDQEMSMLSPQDFLSQILRVLVQPCAVVVGFNFRFGKGRAGTLDHLKEWCLAEKSELEVIPPFQINNETVSTSQVRKLLAEGKVDQVAAMLGRPFKIRGRVIRGDGRGKSLGFPTANLEVQSPLMPRPGVYSAWVRHAKFGKLQAVVHLGQIPTFGVQTSRCEVHILDFHQDIYDETIELIWVQSIRGVQTFAGIEELKAQIFKDVAFARKQLAEDVR